MKILNYENGVTKENKDKYHVAIRRNNIDSHSKALTDEFDVLYLSKHEFKRRIQIWMNKKILKHKIDNRTNVKTPDFNASKSLIRIIHDPTENNLIEKNVTTQAHENTPGRGRPKKNNNK